MPSLLSQAQKESIDSALDLLHETFGVNIYVYVEKDESTTIEGDFNPLYGRSANQSFSPLSRVLTRYTYVARVKYIGDQSESPIEGNLSNSNGQVRIKVDAEACEMIKICSKIEINKNLYKVSGDPSIEGIFSDNYYTFFLNREN